jgi:hypothetical protein
VVEAIITVVTFLYDHFNDTVPNLLGIGQKTAPSNLDTGFS